MKIGGNINAIIQLQTAYPNDLGEDVSSWVKAFECKGYLDLSTGDSNIYNYNSKMQESTHIFLCDYFRLEYKPDDRPDEKIRITPENSRMIIDGEVYEVTIYDDPMNQHEHLEIYLKYLGA